MAGITLIPFREWTRDQGKTCADLRKVTPQDISDFYFQKHWLASHAEVLPLGVDLMVFDAAVNIGTNGSIRLLQECVGLAKDGMIGPLTITAALAIEPVALVAALARAQLAFYQSLAHFALFGEGWTNRVHARRAAAVAMMAMS